MTMRAWLWAVPSAYYPVYLKTGTFAVRRVGRQTLQEVRPGDTIFAYLSGTRVIAGMFEAVGTAFEDATPLVADGHYPYRLRVRPVVTLSEEQWVPYEAFADKLEVARDYADLRGALQRVLHPLPRVDEKVLEFLVRARQGSDLDTVLQAYDAYRRAREAQEAAGLVHEPPAPFAAAPFDWTEAMDALLRAIEAQGFVYEPWQVAAYVAALRSKPFVILAGVTGTGKSRLPALVEAATGGVAHLVPVRPVWTDSAEVLGYVDLQGRFRPGVLLEVARDAARRPEQHVTCILDEMNLARVEQYLAEVLSRLEARGPAAGGGFESGPLLEPARTAGDAAWAAVGLPANLALVGTVNMDEAAHGFSRKVLDRAFTLELAEVALEAWGRIDPEPPPVRPWPASAWRPRMLRPGTSVLADDEHAAVERAVRTLAEANTFLAAAQAQVAYRTRDEVALFILHAHDVAAAFRTRAGTPVDPLDLALHMKLLPRLYGGGRAVRHALFGLLGWAVDGSAVHDEHAAEPLVARWARAGRPATLPGTRFPRTAARLCLMTDRLLADGFTSFWL